MFIEMIRNLGATWPKLTLVGLTLIAAAAMYWIVGVGDPFASVILGFLSVGFVLGVVEAWRNIQAWLLRYVRGEAVDTGPVIFWVDQLITIGVSITLPVLYIQEMELRLGVIAAGIFLSWHLQESWSPYPKVHIPRSAWGDRPPPENL